MIRKRPGGWENLWFFPGKSVGKLLGVDDDLMVFVSFECPRYISWKYLFLDTFWSVVSLRNRFKDLDEGWGSFGCDRMAWEIWRDGVTGLVLQVLELRTILVENLPGTSLGSPKPLAFRWPCRLICEKLDLTYHLFGMKPLGGFTLTFHPLPQTSQVGCRTSLRERERGKPMETSRVPTWSQQQGPRSSMSRWGCAWSGPCV